MPMQAEDAKWDYPGNHALFLQYARQRRAQLIHHDPDRCPARAAPIPIVRILGGRGIPSFLRRQP